MYSRHNQGANLSLSGSKGGNVSPEEKVKLLQEIVDEQMKVIDSQHELEKRLVSLIFRTNDAGR